MNILHQAVRRLERLEALDKVARPLVAGARGRRRGGQALALAGRRAGPAVPDRRNGVCPGQHLHSHGRPAAGGRNQRWLPHLPMARQHVPVRRRQHHAQPGQHARAQLPDTHPDGRIEVRAFA